MPAMATTDVLWAAWDGRGLDSDFTAELDVDRDGLVRDYPDLARRVV
jgi:hypothetical protein